MPAEIHAAAPNRVLSVDVLRGITIAFMILVNDAGDFAHSYAQLKHAQWNGFTLTDLVFPTFLFLVGVSIILSLSTRIARSTSGVLDRATRASLARNIVRRSAIIFLIDLFIAAYPHFHLTQLRLFGVLTRIAICYLVVGLLCLFTRRMAALLAITVTLLVGYWLLMRFVPVPGFGIPTHDIPLLDPDRNLVAVVDRAVNAFLQRTIHTGVLYEHTRDPEGLLSTLPAIATTLIGAITALWLRRPGLPSPTSRSLPFRPEAQSAAAERPASPTPTQTLSPRREAQSAAVEGLTSPPPTQNLSSRPERSAVEGPASLSAQPGPKNNQENTSSQTQHQTLRGLLIASAVCLALGRLWNLIFPINKKLWTSSYVLFAAGLSLLGLALCYYLVDILRLQHRSRLGRAALWPWLVFGSNAITAYAVAELLVETLANIHVHDSSAPARPSSALAWIYRHLFSRGYSTDNTSLAFALCYVAICFLPNLYLWHKRIFLKV